jgi:AcrR family transcriptional regulator
MARPIPSDRFAALIRVATEVFLERGYRRTQMADVAEALGVAKGTLYLYVESKEALFEQVLLHADGPAAIPSPDSLPVPSPEPGSTLSKVRERLLRDAHLPALTDALARRRVSNVRGEIEAIFRELYRLLAAHRVAIKLLDRCSSELPALAGLWSDGGRGPILAGLEQFLRRRTDLGHLPRFAQGDRMARMALEVVVQWAVHARWDPNPDPRFEDDEIVEAAVVEFVTRALCGGGG